MQELKQTAYITKKTSFLLKKHRKCIKKKTVLLFSSLRGPLTPDHVYKSHFIVFISLCS